MNKDELKDVADAMSHCIAMYGHTDSDSDNKFLVKIFYYAGVLAGSL